MVGEITLDDFVIIFNKKVGAIKGGEDSLGSIVLEGCEVEEEIISVRKCKTGVYEVIKRLHFKESKK